MRSVHSTVVQVQQFGAAQLRQQSGVQAGPDAGLGPVPQPAPGRHAGTAHGLCRDVPPGDTGPQHEQDAGECCSVRNTQPPRSRWRRSGAGGNNGATRSHRSSGTRSARTSDTLPTKIAEHKTRSSTHSETISKAAAAIRDGHDAPAQALLANVLDTVMRAHGHAWLRSYFPQAAFPPNPNTGSHKMIAGAHDTYPGSAQLRMLGPYLLVNAMKNVFSGIDRQRTLNRHLGAHKASADSYRSEFAFAALLNTQALLRLVDRYLYA